MRKILWKYFFHILRIFPKISQELRHPLPDFLNETDDTLFFKKYHVVIVTMKFLQVKKGKYNMRNNIGILRVWIVIEFQYKFASFEHWIEQMFNLHLYVGKSKSVSNLYDNILWITKKIYFRKNFKLEHYFCLATNIVIQNFQKFFPTLLNSSWFIFFNVSKQKFINWRKKISLVLNNIVNKIQNQIGTLYLYWNSRNKL